MVPVGDARQHIPFKGRQGLGHAAPVQGRVVRKGGADVAGLHPAHDGKALETLAVVRDPVHELITEAAEFLGVHGSSLAGTGSLCDPVM